MDCSSSFEMSLFIFDIQGLMRIIMTGVKEHTIEDNTIRCECTGVITYLHMVGIFMDECHYNERMNVSNKLS